MLLLPRRPWLAACSALLLAVAGCQSPPAAAVPTPWGLARADTQADADELARLLGELGPRVRALLPDCLDRPTEVWLEDFSEDEVLREHPGVVGLTALDRGHIRIRADRLGRDADFVLVHELVHALLGPSWTPLPAILKEGVCDAVASRLAPGAAERVRAVRFFDASFAHANMALQLHYFEPAQRRRSQLTIPIESDGGLVPAAALVLEGGGIHLHDAFDEEGALYGYGLLFAERIIARIGLGGLHELCLAATDDGLPLVPVDWLLAAAGLDRSPASWRAAVLEELGPAELLALCDHLSGQLAAFMVGSFRHRFPGLDGAAFLDVALPTVGWEGGQARVAVGTVAALRDVLLARWDNTRPTILRPGDGWWLQDRTGLHLTSILEPTPAEDWYTINRLGLGGDESDLSARDLGALLRSGGPTRVEAYLQIGRDREGTFLRTALPGGFTTFRVELDGLVIADLASGLNVRRTTDAHGWVTLTCRLVEGLDLPGMALYHASANLVVSQTAAQSSDVAEQHFPMHVPYLRVRSP